MSDISENSEDPQHKCLILAEKIIASLDDKDLVQRYFNLKKKIFDSQPKSAPVSQVYEHRINADKAYSFYQSLSQENQRLKDEISRLSSQTPNFSDSPDNEPIIEQLRQLESKILPTHSIPRSDTAVQEFESLKKVIEAKFDSLNFVRDKLRTENKRLKSEYRILSRELSSRIEAAKAKEESERSKIEAMKELLNNELIESQRILENLVSKHQSLKEENTNLRNKYNDTVALVDRIQKESSDLKIQIKQMEEESDSLCDEIESLKTQLSIKTKELNALQALQKFGVKAGNDFDIAEEIQRLTERAETLKAENAQMEYELKRIAKRQQSSMTMMTTSTDAISMDEDELAAQILKTKFQ
ncbi:myosin-2 heavy chain [Histomonas meleagridis]|uniref:myosin-2 heavy chain n=1 Tax=Histomonas meleagridis TaxID=135588 RepID=UPI00355A8535|nr:myosin-2 heavy chain [Histomonas meleagridis]KAH0801220.1 myosin-2 heavy chain [Histomonas meleagridis]